jgi:hypothetical protein
MILHMNLNIIENGEHTNKIDLQHWNLDIKKITMAKRWLSRAQNITKTRIKTNPQQGKKITKNANLSLIQN